MAAAHRYRQPDGEACWEEGGVGFAHAHHWTTPEEVGEEQPFSSADGRYQVIADARIDNREELIRELGGAGAELEPGISDARLILAAFERWGEACVPRLLGDFAFAIWDRKQRRLFLARDVMGVRPLYHATHDGLFLFGTTLRAVLAGLPAAPGLNRPLLEEFLRSYYRRWTRETVYDRVERLPPAHWLSITEAGREERLYYVLGSAPHPACRTEAEWAEGFAAVLREAVRCRLRSRAPVAVTTGGGLDSSAIAGIAHELAGASPEGGPEVQLHAAYHAEPAADERRYFDVLAEHCSGFPAIRVPADDCWALREYGTDHDFPLEEPEIYPLRSHSLALFRSAAAHGAQVVLTGEGANQVLGHSVYYHPSALRGIPAKELLRELPHFFRASGNRPARVLFHALIRPLFPEAVVERLRPLRPGTVEWPAWVVQDRPAAPPRPLSRDFTNPPGLRWSARLAHQALRSAFDLARLSVLDVTCAYAGVELRLPFLDRRVVEFLLAAPPESRSWNGEDRRILREAARGLLPEVIRTRRDKASLLGLVHQGLRERSRGRVEALLCDSQAARLGFIVPGPLRECLEAYWSGTHSQDYRFLPVLALEAWLRSLPDEGIIESSR
jgi:asparagine synthase (glutamine-hydrolysing)